MKIIQNVSKDEVYLAWLKGEQYKVEDLTGEELRLVSSPNLDDQIENTKRASLLLGKFRRSPIMNELPTNIQRIKILIEDNDSEKIYIISCLDWFLDTGKSFKLSAVKENLSGKRGHNLPDFPPFEDHKQKIAQISSSQNSRPKDVIMITSNLNSGPFTIIDGAHRASSLLINGTLCGTGGYLGLSDDLSRCKWTQAWFNFRSMNQELNQLVDQGLIW